MTTPNGKSSPFRQTLRLATFKAEPITHDETKVLEKHMRALPRTAIDTSANDQSLNLMMVGCLNTLASKGHNLFTALDITKPIEGGLKFSTFKLKVSELMEELGESKMNMPSSLVSPDKSVVEE